MHATEIEKQNLKQRSASIWNRLLRLLCDAAKGFIQDDCYSKASALTFYSLLSIVPVLAVIFGIAKGFGLEDILRFEITERFGEQKELTEKAIEFAYSWLSSVKADVIAGFGVLVLFWSIVGLLSSIETTLNQIWKIPHSRGIGRRISDYLAAIVICPFFFITSSSMTVWLSHLSRVYEGVVFLQVVNPLLLLFLKLFPYFLSWLLFTFNYYFLPNTRVFLKSALVAGFVGGATFQMWQWVYIKFQVGAASYGAIYGSFAALPLFLVWMQISWIIFLAGAELAVQIENHLFVPLRNVVPLSKKGAALLIAYRCVESFVLGKPPQTDRSLSHEIGLSLTELHWILDALQKEQIIASVSYQQQPIGYQPARPVESITFDLVCQAVDKQLEVLAPVSDSDAFRKIKDYLSSSKELLQAASSNQSICALGPILFSTKVERISQGGFK